MSVSLIPSPRLYGHGLFFSVLEYGQNKLMSACSTGTNKLISAHIVCELNMFTKIYWPVEALWVKYIPWFLCPCWTLPCCLPVALDWITASFIINRGANSNTQKQLYRSLGLKSGISFSSGLQCGCWDILWFLWPSQFTPRISMNAV